MPWVRLRFPTLRASTSAGRRASGRRHSATPPSVTSRSATGFASNGWFGRKTGQGYYVYGDGARAPNPEVDAIIDAERVRAGIIPRDFTDAEITDRCMTAMIAEAVRVLDDGIALRPIDIDAVFLFGYGFPRHRGGPMHHADSLGAKALIDRIERYVADDAYYWKVPNLLRRMADTGAMFADLNKAG